MYTLAIDSLAHGMKRNSAGVASDEDLLALNRASDGQLAKLLSNRSLIYLKQGDAEAAVEDADACTRTDPGFEKGHLRLLAALEANGAPLGQQLAACERGLNECMTSQTLLTRKWQLKKACAAQHDAGSSQTDVDEEELVAETRRLADDLSDPRRSMAAADWGSLLAVGARGVAKDVVKAEHYLQIGSDGGEVSAQRNLGLLLLELQRPSEAALQLSKAAKLGDEQAVGILKQLAGEAEVRQTEMLAKLEALAADGDERAAAMLVDLRASS
jgi:TPR repeat protein